MQKIETREQWNAAIAAWQEGYNKNIGKITKVGIGTYPPKQGNLIVDETGMNNTEVTRDLIRHYAYATGDTNPLWLDEGYARTTRWGGIIAPPRFLDFLCPSYGGIPIPRSDIPGMRPINGGNAVTWFRPLRPGDCVSVVDRFLGATEKVNPDKPDRRMFIIKSLRTYYNQRDEKVAESLGNILCIFNYLDPATPAKESRVSDKYTEIGRHFFTDEELQEVYDSYENEFRRGDEVLYFEDVQEGEELPGLLKGPSTVADSLAFFGGLGYCTAYKIKDQFLRANPLIDFHDPDTNALCPTNLLHISDVHAKKRGLPAAIAFAAQTEGNICHMICNWMGDDGFLQYLYCKSRRINILGDLNRISGKVVRKRRGENGEAFVDLAITVENQDGIVHTEGDATVRLLSREG